MASEDQRNDIRYDLGASATTMPDTEVDRLYVRAGLKYSGNDDAIDAYARLLAIRALRSQAAKLVDYKQNESEEELSQISKQLDGLQKMWEAELETAVAAVSVGVRYAGLRRSVPNLVELPDDYQLGLGRATDVSRID